MADNSPNVALFVYSLDGGGAERVMANLACTFVKQGLKVDLVLIQAKGPYLAQIPPEVRIIELKASQTSTSLPDLIRYLRRERPTALLSTMHYGNEVALWAKRLSGVPTRLVVCEQNTLSQYAQHTSRIVERWTPLWAKLFYPWADDIVAVSQGVAKDLSQLTKLPSERIRVIYNPIVTPELAERAKEPVDHPWFAPGEPPVVLGVGRLVGQKDFLTLIRAFAQVRQVRPARLMILGDNAGSRPALEALVQELGLESDITMPGFVNNPYAYMARAAVFALSSRWEGFGNVIVEAMAVGTPVVSTNCESGPAEILDHGKYGSLVPVGDSQALGTAILQVLAGDSKPIDPAWLTQFSLETTTRQYLEALGITAT
ncbi:MAG: glycosyltransferase [Aphanothece sp. CMT-3BRIN-NPC111]|jgi:glycosyltransferase involved in cell wall biosynthesis|nr:glycosyltransferase [Aphanothece sp. CMT-3BRIN-NPC111]